MKKSKRSSKKVAHHFDLKTISADQKSWLVRFLMAEKGRVAKGPDLKWYLKSRSPTIWNLDKWKPFCKNYLKSGQKCLDFEWSGFQMFATTMGIQKPDAFGFQMVESKLVPKWSGFKIILVFKWTKQDGIQNVRFSNGWLAFTILLCKKIKYKMV